MIVARIVGEGFTTFARHSRNIRATFAEHSHDVRPMKLRTFITIDRLSVVRLSRKGRPGDCRMMVLREMINQEK